MNNTIYHNQSCGKSTGALALLQERGVPVQVVDYQKTPPSVIELQRLAAMLGSSPLGMMRTGDKAFAELGLAVTDQRSEAEWFAIIASHPRLLQRPIVVIGDRAIIARPSELVLRLLG